MSHQPEAAVYDAEVDESKEFVEEFSKAFNLDGADVENWGKLDTILEKARGIAARK